MIASFGYAQAAGKASDSSKTSTTSSKSKKKSTSSSTTKSAKLDINTASKEELSQLPGIGDALSQKIIDGRPYNAKNDLVRRKIIPQSTYDGIKDQIIAHRAGGASKASKKASSGAGN
jgi:DNA uptake protein ComE-like DNA-binding protein